MIFNFNECEYCDFNVLGVCSCYEYYKSFACPKIRKQQKVRRIKKMIFKLLCMLIVLSLAGLVFAVIYLSILKSAKEDFASDEPESVYDSVEVKEVSLDDISNDPEIEQPIEEWATKKDEEYIKDISEAYPEEVAEEAKEALTEQEIGYFVDDVKAVEELAKEQETKIDLDEIKEVVNQIYGGMDESEGYKHLDIPLPDRLQMFTQEQCIDYDVPYELVLALMESESSFRADIGSEKVLGGEEGGPRYYGYMQLSADNCNKASTIYALDAHTPEGNIEMAVLILSGYLEKYYNNWEHAIMAYKGGEGYADSMIANNKVSDAAIAVVNKACKYGVELGLMEE